MRRKFRDSIAIKYFTKQSLCSFLNCCRLVNLEKDLCLKVDKRNYIYSPQRSRYFHYTELFREKQLKGEFMGTGTFFQSFL